LDVGANVGRFTWQCHKLFKEATVYALEPDPTAFRTLQAIHGGTPRVRVFSVAAADKDGDLDFIQRPVSYNSSFLNVAPGADGSTDTTIKVRACTLDRFCAEQSITHIDLLKVDTEGADLLVLQGAKGMLAQGCVDVIMTEVLFVPLYERQATVDEIAAFLASHGFRVFNLYVEHETRYGQAIYGNAIFLGRRLQQKLGRGW
jgi:FkbM family methyltransferase